MGLQGRDLSATLLLHGLQILRGRRLLLPRRLGQPEPERVETRARGASGARRLWPRARGQTREVVSRPGTAGNGPGALEGRCQTEGAARGYRASHVRRANHHTDNQARRDASLLRPRAIHRCVLQHARNRGREAPCPAPAAGEVAASSRPLRPVVYPLPAARADWGAATSRAL